MSENSKRQLNDGPKIRREKDIVLKMIRLYCKKKHRHKELCKECQDINDYALKRLSLCQFGEEKPACVKCPIHCYNPEYRQKIRGIMRFSGPRMLLHHPIEAIRHIPIPSKKRK
ncbi:nitrous oxide-stimulated promoter family protein [Gorillibacterium massiliense]|uniref:nitrous oxide-stimulated promoter family protein n=1 Tax=Gorillibacterium massiliense TaxID=1280390 RepID=UPI0009DE345C|nr:nitrous oxide-stimulated promoter family protein [Gorillibacterium massiliense]